MQLDTKSLYYQTLGVPLDPNIWKKHLDNMAKKAPDPLAFQRFVHSKPKDQRPQQMCEVNCTSKSHESWSQGLSPFFLGPVKLFPDLSGELMVAQNVENAWQYCKVYEEHLDVNGDPSENWWKWAKEGFANKKPVRFP